MQFNQEPARDALKTLGAGKKIIDLTRSSERDAAWEFVKESPDPEVVVPKIRR